MKLLARITYLKCTVLFLLALSTSTIVAEKPANKEVENCWRIGEASGEFYWSQQFHYNLTEREDYKKYYKITELARNDEVVIWSKDDNPDYCYSTKIKDINDPTEKLLAYKSLLVYLQAQFNRDTRGKKIDAIFDEIEEVTGKRFNTFQEFIVWFSTNSEVARNRIFRQSDAVSYWYYGRPYIEFDIDNEYFWCTTKHFYAMLYCETTKIENIYNPESRATANINRVKFYLDMFRCNLLRNTELRLNEFNNLVENNFESMTEFVEWWDVNKEYLYWSENSKQLIVDEQSKELSKPLRTFEPDYQTSDDITAEKFWHEHMVGNYSHLIDEGNVYRICISLPHSPGSKTILKSLVDDRKSKERAFKKALDERIDFYSDRPEEQQLLPLEKFNSPIASITHRLLVEKFATAKELFEWYYENKDNLVLSEDGEKLVVKGPSD